MVNLFNINYPINVHFFGDINKLNHYKIPV